MLLFRDIIHFNVPEHVLAARAFLEGRLPQWNPFLYGGTPLLAEPDIGVFYPPNWLFLVLDPWRAATAFVLLHLPIAAWGALALGRRLGLSRAARAVAACGFTASGYLLSMNGGHYYVRRGRALPARGRPALASGRSAPRPPPRRGGRADRAPGVRRRVPDAALHRALRRRARARRSRRRGRGRCGAGIAPARRPEKRNHLVAYRRAARARRLRRSGAGDGPGRGPAAPLPLLGRGTLRAHGLALDQAAQWALHPLRLVDLVVPQPWGMPYPDNGFFGSALINGAHGVPWAPSLWLGTLLPLLALGTPWRALRGRRAALVAVAALSLLCAMGTRTPLFALLRTVAPLVDRFRYPEKFALPATLAIALIGAFRLDDLTRAQGGEQARRAVSRLLLAAAAVLAALLAGAALHPPVLLDAIAAGLRGAQGNVPALAACSTLQGALFESALLCVVGALACAAGARRRGLLPAIVLCATAAAQTANGLAILSYGSADSLRHEPAIARALLEEIPPGSAGRVFSAGGCRFDGAGSGSLLERVSAFHWETGRENVLSLFGLRAAIGYGAVEDPAQVALFHALALLAPDAGPRAFGAALRYGCDASNRLRIERIATPLPRVRVARPLALPEAEDARARALIGEADAGYAAALLEPEEVARIPAPGAAGSAAVLAETPEELAVRVEGGGGVLVLADRFSDGWSARLDGDPVPHLSRRRHLARRRRPARRARGAVFLSHAGPRGRLRALAARGAAAVRPRRAPPAPRGASLS